MLLIGFATYCDIPQYYFEITADYGWVTSIVFQDSVILTYPIFQRNPAMRHWRAMWMTFQAGFIFVGQILTYHKDWMLTFGMSTQCIWNGFSTWYKDASTMILVIFTLGLQLWSYLWAMEILYPRQLGWTAYPYQAVVYVSRLPARLHARLKGTWKRPSRLQKGVLAATYTIFIITHMVSQLFGSALLGLVRSFSMLLWGFRYIMKYRQSDNISRVVGIQGSEDEWSAGQICLYSCSRCHYSRLLNYTGVKFIQLLARASAKGLQMKTQSGPSPKTQPASVLSSANGGQ